MTVQRRAILDIYRNDRRIVNNLQGKGGSPTTVPFLSRGLDVSGGVPLSVQSRQAPSLGGRS